MSSKMTTNSQLPTTESKKKNPKNTKHQTKQTTEQEQNLGYGDHLEVYQWGEWWERYRD